MLLKLGRPDVELLDKRVVLEEIARRNGRVSELKTARRDRAACSIGAVVADDARSRARRGEDKVARRGIAQIEKVDGDGRDVCSRQTTGRNRCPRADRRLSLRCSILIARLIECAGNSRRRTLRAEQRESERHNRCAARRRHKARHGLCVLVAAEEVPTLFFDRAADGKAAFVATRLWPVNRFFVKEEIVGVEFLVLKIVIDRAVEAVCARLCDELEIAAARTTRRSIVERGLEFYFLKRLGRGRDVVVQRAFVSRDIGRVHAVKEQARRSGARAVDRRTLVAVAIGRNGRKVCIDSGLCV